jgi:hypothetical protein
VNKNALTYLLSFGLFFWISGYNAAFGQEKRWSEEKLTWLDYKNFIQQSGIHHAFTYSGITFEMSSENDTVILQVYSYFDPSQSWVHPDHRVPTLLNHEQLHFDITELFARMMRKEMSEYFSKHVSEFVKAKMDTQVKSIFTKLSDDHTLMQQKYDVETQHGILSDEQANWEKNISVKLKELDAYSTGL